jgi:hypothetical protein
MTPSTPNCRKATFPQLDGMKVAFLQRARGGA